MRALENEMEFLKFLDELGNDTIAHPLPNHPKAIQLPDQIVLNGSENDLINFVFDNDDANYNKAILCPLNRDALEINETILSNKISGDNHVYMSIDSIKTYENNDPVLNLEVEDLHVLTPTGMPPHILNLKVNCIVMLLRNMLIHYGLCNGARLTVLQLYKYTIFKSQICSITILKLLIYSYNSLFKLS